MAVYRILVPSGIGDFSWTWSKLVTTNDQYHIEYIGGKPDRMFAFLSLLPSDRVLSYSANDNYYTKWNENGELVCVSRDIKRFPQLSKINNYSDLRENQLAFVESNTFLERGNRLEGWLGNEIPKTDFHYKVAGALEKSTKGNYFIVNFSSYGTKKAWGYYEVPSASNLVELIAKKTGWSPLFIGGTYDDFTSDIHAELLNRGINAVSLVGKTPDLGCVMALLQQARMYFGACSGLMVLSNILHTPVVTYYPPFNTPPGRHLAGTWHDPAIPYMSLFWEGESKDRELVTEFLNKIGG